jgi:hypothetical protein
MNFELAANAPVAAATNASNALIAANAPVPAAATNASNAVIAANAVAAAIAENAVAVVNAPKSTKVNNWNKFVSTVLENMKTSGWANPNSGKPPTRRNAMLEASKRKAAVNANYAKAVATRRARRNKQLASRTTATASAAAGNGSGNVPPATANNVVLVSGPPRKGIDPPPSIYKKPMKLSIPTVFSPSLPNSREGVTLAVEKLESLLQNSTMPADKRERLEAQLAGFKARLV